MKSLRQLAQPIILRALREDIGAGDITTKAVLPRNLRIRARIVARASGIVAGADVARWVFETVDHRIRCTVRRRDGKAVRRGQIILSLEGPASGIFAAERTALNLLGHLSGVATLTQQFVQCVRGTRAKILDTRKTTPGLRDLEKEAVRAGGGRNHRHGLDDAVLIKTNHLRAVTSGEWRVASNQIVKTAVAKARRIRPRKFVEIEVTNLREFRAVLSAKPDAVLLDNWRASGIRKAVVLRASSSLVTRHSLLLEVSGGVTLQNVRRIARTGVDRISIGRLTHSAPSLDVSLEVST